MKNTITKKSRSKHIKTKKVENKSGGDVDRVDRVGGRIKRVMGSGDEIIEKLDFGSDERVDEGLAELV